MNKQIILEIEDVLRTYKYRRISHRIKELQRRNWFPILKNSSFGYNSAYLVGKVIGDGNLDPLFTCRFIGQREDLIDLRTFICNNFSLPCKSFTLYFRQNAGVSYLLQVNDALFGRLLYALGAPMGNKVKTPFQSFGVQCSRIDSPHLENIKKDGDRTFSQCFRILGNKKNMLTFSKNLGFFINQSKVKELNACLEKVNAGSRI